MANYIKQLTIGDNVYSIKTYNPLTIQFNGTNKAIFDGDQALSVNITPSAIGAATSGHTHNYAGSSSAGGPATNIAVPRVTKSILTIASEQALDTQAIWFNGSDATSPTSGLMLPKTYCISEIKKGNSHRTLIDAYCLTTGEHWVNYNLDARSESGWSGWQLQPTASHRHTVSHTPAGTVSTPTITVTPNTTSMYSITAVGTLPSASLDAGTLPSVEWSAGTLPSATLNKGTLPSHTYTAPSHSYTAPSLTGHCDNQCLTIDWKVGTHSFSAGSHSFSAGALPSLTFSAGSLPSLTFDEGTLPSLTFNAGTLPTKGSATTVVTGIKSATSSQPTFTGTAATLTSGTFI